MACELERDCSRACLNNGDASDFAGSLVCLPWRDRYIKSYFKGDDISIYAFHACDSCWTTLQTQLVKMNVLQQFEEEYQVFLASLKETPNQSGKKSAYHAAPSTGGNAARHIRSGTKKQKIRKRRLSLPSVDEPFTRPNSPKRDDRTTPVKRSTPTNLSLAELETKRLSLPYLETIQYVHLELERRGIVDNGSDHVRVLEKSLKGTEQDVDEDDDIFLGMTKRPLHKKERLVNFDDSFGNAPVFDERTLRKRYPAFSDHLDHQSPSLSGVRRQTTWLFQMIEEIYDARYMFEVDELSSCSSKSFNKNKAVAIDMSKSIRRMQRHKRSFLGSHVDVMPFLHPDTNVPSYARKRQKIALVSSGSPDGEESNETSREPALSFASFVYMYLSKMFGLKLLIHQTAWDMLYNLEYLKEDYPEAMIFSLFLREVRDIDSTLFYLHCREIIQNRYTIQFKTKEKVVPHNLHVNTLVTQHSRDGKLLILDHPKLMQVRMKKVFLTRGAVTSVCQSIFANKDLPEYIVNILLGPFFQVKSAPLFVNSTLDVQTVEMNGFARDKPVLINCIDTIDVLEQLVSLFDDTPDEIVSATKYGDDSEQVAMLGKLRETSETKTKLDHFEKKIKNLTRQVQLQETKVDLLKRKHNEQGKRTLIFLEENELWRRKQAVVTAETDFQSLMESNDRVWLDVLGDRRNEVKNARKLQLMRGTLVPWKYSVYVDGVLQRFETWVKEKHRKWALTSQVLKLLGKSWEEQLEDLKLKYTIKIQRLWRERMSARVAQKEAQERLAFEREERRKRNEKRQIAENALKKRREREKQQLDEEIARKKKIEDDILEEKKAKRRKLNQNAVVFKKRKALEMKWKREKFHRWCIHRRSKKMKLQRSRELLKCLIGRWKSKVALTRMFQKKQADASTQIQTAWRIFLAKNVTRLAKARVARNEVKVKEFMKRIKYGEATRIFQKWAGYSEKMSRAKAFMEKHYGQSTRKILRIWQSYARECNVQRCQCAIRVQNAWRRKQGIVTYIKKRNQRDAARTIQRSIRAYLARKILELAKVQRDANEIKVLKMVKKIKYKWVMIVVSEWHVHADKMNRMRRLVNSGLRHILNKTFEAWKRRYISEKQAAYAIQCIWRRYSAHIRVTQMLLVSRKATIIQKYWRRSASKKAALKLMMYRFCSTQIQRSWRGFAGRLFYHKKRVDRILQASRNKDYEVVELAFATLAVSGPRGYSVHGKMEGSFVNAAGVNALMMASLVGSKRIIKLCLRNGIGINNRDFSGRTALHYVMEGGYLGDDEIIEYLLVKGSDRNARDHEGKTPIMDAAILGRTDALKTLIELGALIDLPDIHGQTPLHVAAVLGRGSVVNILLRANAKVIAYDKTGCCVLHDICNRGIVGMLEIIIPFSASVNVQDNDGMTPMMHAVIGNHRECVRLLVWAMADLNIVDNNGYTALHHAALTHDTSITQILTEAFADVNALDKNGETALHVSCREGDVKNAKLLLAFGTDWRIRNWRGNFPIHIAAEEGQVEVARLLISYEVEVNVLNYDQKTPLGLARLIPNHEMIQLFDESYILQSEVDKNAEATAASLLGVVLEKPPRDTSTAPLLDSLPDRFERPEWQTRLRHSSLVFEFAEYEEYAERIKDTDADSKMNGEDKERPWWRNVKTNACTLVRPSQIIEEGTWAPVKEQNEEGRWVTVKYQNDTTGDIVIGKKPPTLIKSKRLLQQRPTLEAEKGDLSLVDYKEFFEAEKVILMQQLLERDSAVFLQKHYRGHLARVLYANMRRQNHAAITIERVVRGWIGRTNARRWREQIKVATDLQRIFRGCSTRKSIQRMLPFLRRRQCVARSTVLINRLWRGYLARRELRRMYWRIYWGPKDDAQWRVVRKEQSYLRRIVNRWEERIISGTYDVVFYVDKFKLSCQWKKPSDVEAFDEREKTEATELRLWGFTKAQEKVATRLQSIWRGRQMAKTFRIMVKAKKLMVGSDVRYLQNPNSIENLCNYMMHLTCFPPHNYDRARVLYSKAFEYMVARGPDNSFILFAYAIFVSSTREEDDLSIVDYVRRGHLRPKAKEKFELAEKGFYRMASLWHPDDALCQHLYALCLQWVCKDYDQSEEYYLRAMEITCGRDKIIVDNFNYMLANLKGVDYDAEHCMRERALKQASEETRLWMEKEEQKRQDRKELEDSAARALQFRWRLKKLGLSDYWLWGIPKLSKKKEVYVDDEEVWVPQIEGEAYEDPTDWEVCEDGYGGTYYYNVQTGESRWKKPNFRIEDVELVHGPGYEGLTAADTDFDENPEDWEICNAHNGGTYYYNVITGESRWTRPKFQTDDDYEKMKEGHGASDHFAKIEMQLATMYIPHDWEAVKDAEGRTYFWNKVSGESTWTIPADDSTTNGSQKTGDGEGFPLPENWEECDTGDGVSTYYFNRVTGESVWERPKAAEVGRENVSAERKIDNTRERTNMDLEKCYDAHGNVYWYNKQTEESSWDAAVE